MGPGLRGIEDATALLERLQHRCQILETGKRGGSDAVDAEVVYEALSRPTMRFVEIKSEDQRALLSLHRARDFVVRQSAQLINMFRNLAAEFGIARGVVRAIDYAKGIIDSKVSRLPELAQYAYGFSAVSWSSCTTASAETRSRWLSKLIPAARRNYCKLLPA